MNKMICLAALLTSSVAFAEPKIDPTSPISTSLRFTYERVKGFILASAAEVPDAQYSYKPTADVRSFAELFGHIADSEYMFCGGAKGDKSKHPEIEKKATTKAAVKKGLDDAFAYCDAVYAGMTDAQLTQPTGLFGGKLNKFGALDVNTGHLNEHYGNLVTYLRMKQLVPPSSAEK